MSRLEVPAKHSEMRKRPMLLLWASAIFLLWVSSIVSAKETSEQFSTIALDEHIVFFRTSGWLNEEQDTWEIPIHGWVYEPQNSRIRKSNIAKILQHKYDFVETEETESNFSRRINLLLSDNERGKTIVITMLGREYVLPRSAANGHFQATLKIPSSDVAGDEQEFVQYAAVLNASDKRYFEGKSMLPHSGNISVISDIDDTVKVTHVTERPKLVDATFFQDFSAVEGMAALYQSWHQQGANFHFVSSSPWQLNAPLVEFLDESSFPWATMSLKSIRFRDTSILNLFKKGTQTKPAAIEAILSKYPTQTFILVGDSGEQDAEVYAKITEKYPSQIRKILIRDIKPGVGERQKFEQIFSKIEKDKWQLFEVPEQITLDFEHLRQ